MSPYIEETKRTQLTYTQEGVGVGYGGGGGVFCAMW